MPPLITSTPICSNNISDRRKRQNTEKNTEIQIAERVNFEKLKTPWWISLFESLLKYNCDMELSNVFLAKIRRKNRIIPWRIYKQIDINDQNFRRAHRFRAVLSLIQWIAWLSLATCCVFLPFGMLFSMELRSRFSRCYLTFEDIAKTSIDVKALVSYLTSWIRFHSSHSLSSRFSKVDQPRPPSFLFGIIHVTR